MSHSYYWFVGPDESEQDGTHQEHGGNHVEWQIIVARRLDEHAENDAAEETTDVASRVHRTGDGAGMVLAEVNAECPGTGQHQVEDADLRGIMIYASLDKNTKTAILPGMKATRNIQTAETAREVEPSALRPMLTP